MPTLSTFPESINQPTIDLNQQSILVTGASSDVGHHICLGLAQRGATLLLLERKQRLVSGLYDEIIDQGGEEPLIIEFDITKAEDQHFNDLADGIGKSFDRINGLLHLAMSAGPLAPVTLSQTQSWTTAFDQVLLRPMLLTKSLLPLLLNAKDAAVIFSVLEYGREGKAYWGTMGSAFAGLENLIETLTDEHPNIRFHSLDFGQVASALRKKFFPAESKASLRSFQDPVILDHILYLLCASSQLKSGERFRVPNL